MVKLRDQVDSGGREGNATARTQALGKVKEDMSGSQGESWREGSSFGMVALEALAVQEDIAKLHEACRACRASELQRKSLLQGPHWPLWRFLRAQAANTAGAEQAP